MSGSVSSSQQQKIELISRLLSSSSFKEHGLDAALREVAEISVDLLDVDRLSIWLFQPGEASMNRTLAYNREKREFQAGTVFDISERQNYLDAMMHRNILTISDTHKCPEIDSIREKYLKPIGIRALMDGAIRQHNEFMGSVVASQLDKPRNWTSEEMSCLRIVCQAIANLLEQESRTRAEDRLKDWLDTSSVSQWEMDQEFRYTRISYQSSFGWGIDDDVFLGKTRWEANGAKPDDPFWKAHVETHLQHKPFRNFVYPVQVPDQGQKMLSISANPVFDRNGDFLGYRGTTSDITVMTGVEIALEETERRFKDLVDGSIQGVGVTVNHKVVFANEAFARTFGYSVDEVVGMTDIDFVAPEERGYRLKYQARREEGAREMQGVTKSGEIRQLEAFAKNMSWGGEDARLLTIVDITERKIAEEHLRHAQKMEAVGELTGGIAHDFNNLLTIIMGNAELMEDLVSGQEEETRLILSNIQRASQGGAALTRRLLAFARRQPLKAETTDIARLVEGLSSMFGHTLGEKTEIDLMFQPDLPNARVDRTQLENVLLNLAINARDAMPEGGRFSVRCGQYRFD